MLRLSTGMKIFNDIYAINSGIYCRDESEVRMTHEQSLHAHLIGLKLSGCAINWNEDI